jgi:hypothetical protein
MLGFITALAGVYLIIWFVRGGWRVVTWLVLELLGGAIHLIARLCGLAFWCCLLGLIGGGTMYLCGLIVTTAILIFIPNVILRLQRAKGLAGMIGRIMFGDEK